MYRLPMRFRNICGACVVLALNFSTAAVAQDAPLVMEPTGPWVVDYGEERCALAREFGQDDRKVTLVLRQYGPGPGFEITVTSKSIDRRQRPPRFGMEPSSAFFKLENAEFPPFADGFEGVMFGFNFRRGWDDPPAEELADWSDAERDTREASITSLFLGETFEHDLRLMTGELHKPMEVMRNCTDTLLTNWGLDAETHKTLSRRVTPVDIERWAGRFSTASPLAGEGAVRVRLLVGADGSPASCHVQWGVAAELFEESCDLLMRYARFEPALDAEGKPIPSYYLPIIRYSM